MLRRHFKKGPIRVVIVRDTRGSGPALVQQLSAGLREMGVDVYDAGVLNTPSVAYLVKAHHFQSGVVVSASHNPPEFNGIKFFSDQGRKWPDTWEHVAEKIFFSNHWEKKAGSIKTLKKGHLIDARVLVQDYENFLFKTLPTGLDLSHLRIGVDCSHGANSQVAPELLRRLGARIFLIGNKPDGKNINMGCGSQNTAALARIVKKNRCHLGISFDGDGDRVIFVDEKGKTVDGDFIIGLLARHLKAAKKLAQRKVVITVMANLGLRLALSRIGVRAIETPVGDRYVSEAMKREGSILGGEQSGHIIMGAYLPTGDGLLTALHVLLIVQKSKKTFSQLVGWMKKFPQVLVNVRVPEKKPISQMNGVQKKIDDIEKTLGQKGRVLIRYSGTEPLLRIMLEGPHKPQLDQYATTIKDGVCGAFKK